MADAKASFRVRYFPLAGRAAPLRLALYLGGITFEDEFVDFTEHKTEKQNGTRRWSGLPELVVLGDDGKEIATVGQSKAQMRYVAQLGGLYPSNAIEAARVDEIMDSLSDTQDTLSYKGEKDKDKQKALREAAIAKDGSFSYWIKKFVLRLEENKQRGNTSGFMVGDSVTIADVMAMSSLNFIVSGYWDHIPKDYYTNNYPKIAAFIANVGKNEKIKEFNSQFAERVKDYKDESQKDKLKVVTYGGMQECEDSKEEELSVSKLSEFKQRAETAEKELKQLQQRVSQLEYGLDSAQGQQTLQKKEYSAGVFLYVELGMVASFEEMDWKQVNSQMQQYQGLMSKTYLSGIDDGSLGGFYHFDTRENAQKYIDEYLKKFAADAKVTLTCKLFEGKGTEMASCDMNSPFFPKLNDRIQQPRFFEMPK